MLKEYYEKYLSVNRRLRQSSVIHYLTGINTINSIIKHLNLPITDIYDVRTIEELEAIRDIIFHNELFIRRNSIGNQMYSVALNHFYRFICEADSLDIDGIQLLDIPLPKPKKESFGSNDRWQRNHVIKSQVIQFAHYNCEYDMSHMTFTSERTGMKYMEGHHIIPMEMQSHFCNSLDVYANIICLCPICHRLLHHGVCMEKNPVLTKMYQDRADRLYHSGLGLRYDDFIQIFC